MKGKLKGDVIGDSSGWNWIRIYDEEKPDVRGFIRDVGPVIQKNKAYFHVLGPYVRDRTYWEFRFVSSSSDDYVFKELNRFDDYDIIKEDFEEVYRKAHNWDESEFTTIVDFLMLSTLLWTITEVREDELEGLAIKNTALIREIAHLFNVMHYVDDCDFALSHFWGYLLPFKTNSFLYFILQILREIDVWFKLKFLRRRFLRRLRKIRRIK